MVDEFVVKNGLITPVLKIGTVGSTSVNFPTVDGSSGQVLITDGSGNLSFTNRVVAIDDLSDVDTSTVPPNMNEALVWNGSQWIPYVVGGLQNVYITVDGDTGSTTADITTDTIFMVGGAGILTSVTTDTVTIENTIVAIDDLSDVDTSTVPPTNNQVLSWNGSQWAPASAGGLQNVYITIDGDTGSTTANITTDILSIVGGTGITTVATTDTLTINNSIVSIDDLSDVDTSTVAPTVRATLEWNGSQWTPDSGYATVTSDPGTSITLAASDHNTIINTTSSSAVTVTLPDNLDVGFMIAIEQVGTGTVTFSASGGASLLNVNGHSSISGQHGVVSLYVRSNAGGSSAIYTLSGATA